MQPGGTLEGVLARGSLHRAALRIEDDLAVRRQRFARNREAHTALESFKLQRQPAGKILDDLLADITKPGKRLDRHPHVLQSACLPTPNSLSWGRDKRFKVSATK